MTKRRHALTALLLVALLGLSPLLLAGSEAGYHLLGWTVDGGGGVGREAGYVLLGTAGQADAGVLSGSGYRLSGGLWHGQAAAWHAVYLPSVQR